MAERVVIKTVLGEIGLTRSENQIGSGFPMPRGVSRDDVVDFEWEGGAERGWGEDDLEVMVSSEVAEPPDALFEYVGLMVDKVIERREQILGVMLDYYKRFWEEHVKGCDDGLFDEDDAPENPDLPTFVGLLDSPELVIQSGSGDVESCEAVLNFGCAWDVEHGVAVLLGRDGQLTVGQGGEFI